MTSSQDQGPISGDLSEKDGSSPTNPSLTVAENQEASIPPVRFWMLSVGILLGLFLSMIDTSIVATSLYTIGLEFESFNTVNWVALAYTLAYLGCAVVFARISDIIGRRNAFITAYIIFFAFSLACGFAQSLNQLIAFRVLQGVGGSGLYSLTMIMMPEMSPSNLRHHIAALVGMIVALAGVLGPVLGGLLTHYASWRWVFWINGPIGIISMTIFFLTWPRAEYLPSIERRAWKELDYAGSFLTISAAVLVVFSFQNAGASSGDQWSKAIFIAPLVCGLFAWALLASWQYVIHHRFEDRLAPAFPLSIFKNRVYTAAVLNTLFLGYPYLLLIYAIPVRIQVVGGKSSLEAGVMLLPMLGTAAIGSALAGKINAVKNYVFETLLVGSCFMTMGCGLLTTLSHELDLAKQLGFVTLCGTGFGLTIASSTMMSTIEVSIRNYAPAQGILSQVRLLGGSLGIASSTALLHQKVTEYLTGILTPSELNAIGGADLHLSDSQLEMVHYTYAESFRADMRVAAAISALGLLSTLGAYRRRRLVIQEQRQILVTEEIARRREVTRLRGEEN
ncbi:major facilitator superfamily domain-containing protein [Dactylonectria macrodidyma]|uniref:Major facilitator superfamily domain-containing protein n=1 Tax=Dactylonectria macrodidyma TaxID=307937 RepID=A0A9P9FRL1_9HYPO|nr:major facilitator superfamily domain-containing protein [Dactylonectria macrodidyma]